MDVKLSNVCSNKKITLILYEVTLLKDSHVIPDSLRGFNRKIHKCSINCGCPGCKAATHKVATGPDM